MPLEMHYFLHHPLPICLPDCVFAFRSNPREVGRLAGGFRWETGVIVKVGKKRDLERRHHGLGRSGPAWVHGPSSALFPAAVTLLLSTPLYSDSLPASTPHYVSLISASHIQTLQRKGSVSPPWSLRGTFLLDWVPGSNLTGLWPGLEALVTYMWSGWQDHCPRFRQALYTCATLPAPCD
jgi:hypothetical protein